MSEVKYANGEVFVEGKWGWMMDWCRARHYSPADFWEEAKEVYKKEHGSNKEISQ